MDRKRHDAVDDPRPFLGVMKGRQLLLLGHLRFRLARHPLKQRIRIKSEFVEMGGDAAGFFGGFGGFVDFGHVGVDDAFVRGGEATLFDEDEIVADNEVAADGFGVVLDPHGSLHALHDLVLA